MLSIYKLITWPINSISKVAYMIFRVYSAASFLPTAVEKQRPIKIVRNIEFSKYNC